MNQHGLQGHVFQPGDGPGFHQADFAHHILALHDPAEYGVAGPAHAGIQEGFMRRLMKNWLPALSGSSVRAMATVQRSLRRPLSDSLTTVVPGSLYSSARV